MKKRKETSNVRIDNKVISKVRKKVAVTKQSLGGYFEIAASEKLERDNFPPNINQNPTNQL